MYSFLCKTPRISSDWQASLPIKILIRNLSVMTAGCDLIPVILLMNGSIKDKLVHLNGIINSHRMTSPCNNLQKKCPDFVNRANFNGVKFKFYPFQNISSIAIQRLKGFQINNFHLHASNIILLDAAYQIVMADGL